MRFTKSSCGVLHTLFLSQDGEVFGCGSGTQGQLGQELKENVNVIPKKLKLQGHKVIDVACGSFHSVIMTGKGLDCCWITK